MKSIKLWYLILISLFLDSLVLY